MTQVPEWFKAQGGLVIGKKWYMVCGGCKRLIRINKPILGSTHVCG